jgi:glycosyltransferase involved in cell wall biosynthesis
MKIAIVSVFSPYRGGIAQFNEELVRSLELEGHEVCKVNFKRQYPKLLFPGKSQFEANIAHRVDCKPMLDSIAPPTWRKTAKYIKELAPDLVVLPFWSGYLAPALSGVLNNLGTIPVHILVHNAIPHDSNPLQRYLTQRFINKGKSFITLSNAVSDDIRKLNTTAKVKTLFHPIYTHFGEKINQDKALYKLDADLTKKTLLFFGLVRKYKGLDTLLKAFALLPDNYQLLIAGEAYDDVSNYKKLISEDTKKRIHWKNEFIPTADVSLWFSAADVLILPYRNATQSGVTASALHFDIPIIASNVGGLSEYILNERTGLLVDEPNPENFAKAIEQWFALKTDEADLKASVKEIRERMSWESFAKGLVG